MIELFEKIKEKLENNENINKIEYQNNRIILEDDEYFYKLSDNYLNNYEIIQINKINLEIYHIFSINIISFEEREEILYDIISNYLIKLLDY